MTAVTAVAAAVEIALLIIGHNGEHLEKLE